MKPGDYLLHNFKMTTLEKTNDPVVQSGQPPQSTSPVQPMAQPGKKRSKLIYLALIAFTILVLAGGGVAAYLVLSDNDSDKGEDNDNEETTKTCTYGGQTYQEGDAFKSSDGCNSCGCADGEVVCTLMACDN